MSTPISHSNSSVPTYPSETAHKDERILNNKSDFEYNSIWTYPPDTDQVSSSNRDLAMNPTINQSSAHTNIYTDFQIAAKNGDFEEIKKLLKHPICLNSIKYKDTFNENQTALDYSRYSRNFQVYKLLWAAAKSLDEKSDDEDSDD